MGKIVRIDDADIRSMQKTLDALPDKTLGRTRDEALSLLLENLKKALKKGYSLKELMEIMKQGNVSIPIDKLRKSLLAEGTATGAAQKKPPRAERKIESSSVPNEKAKIKETPSPMREKEAKMNVPAYYTPDKNDEDL